MADNKVNSGLLEFSEDQKVFVALDAETSEVKKAVTIDGDGVETDITGGGGGGVTVEALNVTENGTYSEEGKAYSPVVVDVESDMSIINITIQSFDSGGGATDDYYIPIIDREYNSIRIIRPTAMDTDITLESVTYKGKLEFLATENIVVSGSATYDQDTFFVSITGDCTLKGVAVQ